MEQNYVTVTLCMETHLPYGITHILLPSNRTLPAVLAEQVMKSARSVCLFLRPSVCLPSYF